MVKEVSRLNATVEEVLQYSRKQPGRDIPTEPLSQVISRVIKLLDTQLRNKSVACAVQENSKAAGFMVDGDRLSQVFLNIIVNALDAVSSGGKIEIRFRKEPGGLSISISDNGPGIPAVEREKIFEPFFSKKEGGTGLGLSISRKIVASYGGSLTLSKDYKNGACFTVSLPHQEKASGSVHSSSWVP
jgi:signal transduction histidine kinase